MQFSVIIPTHQRFEKLERLLHSLASQRQPPRFEVIIVFDGPDPAHEDRARSLGDRLKLKQQVLMQPAQGPGAARNRGARAAQGERLLFLGDDVLAEPELLAEHARTAREHPGAAVQGFVPWAKGLRVTRFMRFIAPERGPQFHFGMIQDPLNCGFEFCFTANFALPRAAWEAEPFDEAFPHAAGEDTEWSWRLHQRGLRIVYNARAVAGHDHAVTLEQFVERQRRAGRAAAYIWRKHPALRSHPGLYPDAKDFFLSPLGQSWREKLITLRVGLKHYLGLPVSDLDYWWLLARAYLGALNTELQSNRGATREALPTAAP